MTGPEHWESDGDGVVALSSRGLALALLPLPPASVAAGTVLVGGLDLGWWPPFEVLPDVAVTAAALAGLVNEVVSALGPEVLGLLLLGPRLGGPASRPQVLCVQSKRDVWDAFF